MKYIIEIEDKPLKRETYGGYGTDAVWRAKGFNSLVFDRKGLDMLEPLVEHDTDFKVGDQVIDDGGKKGYVLIPTDKNGNIVVCMKEHGFPQSVDVSRWKKTGDHSNMFELFVARAYEALEAQNRTHDTRRTRNES